MARRSSCPLPKSTGCRGSRLTRPARSARTSWRCSFERSFGTPVTVVRPFNTYGPRQSARARSSPPEIIPRRSPRDSARSKLGSIHPTRDLQFRQDRHCQGLPCGARDQVAGIGEVINIGSGFEISIGDTAQMIAELMGARIEIEHDDTVRVRPRSAAKSTGCGPATTRRRSSWDGPCCPRIAVVSRGCWQWPRNRRSPLVRQNENLRAIAPTPTQFVSADEQFFRHGQPPLAGLM